MAATTALSGRPPRARLGLALALALLALPAGAKAEGAGMRRMTVDAPEQGRTLDVTLWYPAEAGGYPVEVGGNAIFQGAPARQDAPMAPGPLPLVLLSHGGLRSAAGSGGWIAAGLAGAGFMVAEVEPPRLQGERVRHAAEELWLRPADLSATLDALQAVAEIRDRIDETAFGALGFHLGGTAVLGLVGGRIDGQRYARSCDAGGTGIDCGWFAANGIDLHAADLGQVARSRLDRRIAAAMAVDPEMAELFTPQSLGAIEAPVGLVRLGPPEAAGSDLSRAAGEIPGAVYRAVDAAGPFDAFARCTPRAVAILEEEGEAAAICVEGAPPRAQVHARLTQLIADFFRSHRQSTR
jgi:predicted dienelactone hydrolase